MAFHCSMNELLSIPIPTRCHPMIVGVAGGSSSGKHTLCKTIKDRLETEVFILPLSWFQTSTENQFLPKGYDFDALDKVIERFQSKKLPIQFNIFNTSTNEYDIPITVDSLPVVVFVVGCYALYDNQVRNRMTMNIFVQVDADSRLSNTVFRNKSTPLDKVLLEYMTKVKPAIEDFVLPTQSYADLIIPRGIENSVAIELVVNHIREAMKSGNPSTRRPSFFGDAERSDFNPLPK